MSYMMETMKCPASHCVTKMSITIRISLGGQCQNVMSFVECSFTDCKEYGYCMSYLMQALMSDCLLEPAGIYYLLNEDNVRENHHWLSST